MCESLEFICALIGQSRTIIDIIIILPHSIHYHDIVNHNLILLYVLIRPILLTFNKIKQILFETGYGFVWLNQNVSNNKYCFNQFEERCGGMNEPIIMV